MRGRDGGQTDFSFFDTGVDSIQQVSSVPVALGEFSQFFPDQLPLVVAHHLLERWVHVLEKKYPGLFEFHVCSRQMYLMCSQDIYLYYVVLAGDLHSLLTVIQGSED